MTARVAASHPDEQVFEAERLGDHARVSDQRPGRRHEGTLLGKRVMTPLMTLHRQVGRCRN